MNTSAHVVAVASAVLLLGGCPSADFPTCSSAPVSFTGGPCSAYYYKGDFGSGGATTQALTDCTIAGQRVGGNVVAFHTLEHGIGLRWLDAQTLEVAVPAGVKLESQRQSDVYMGVPLKYVYRELLPNEPSFRGCVPQRARGGT